MATNNSNILSKDQSESEFDNRFIVSRYFSGRYLESFERVFENNSVQYNLTETQELTLQQVKDSLESELMFMSTGLSSIGYMLAIAAANEVNGVAEDEIERLGWYLNFLGNQIKEHAGTAAHSREILAHCVVSPGHLPEEGQIETIPPHTVSGQSLDQAEV